MVEMLRPCKVKRSSRVGRVVTCRKCWVHGTEKEIISVKCPGKPEPGSGAFSRGRTALPATVQELHEEWGVN